MPSYTVKQGDCISSIAYEHGFFWKTLWNHANNADLKRKRRDPNVLLEADIVYIPDLTPKVHSGATEQRHRFCRKGVPAKLRLRLMREPENRRTEEIRQTVQYSRGGRELAIQSESPPQETQSEEPRANAPFRLQIDGHIFQNGQTDDDGRIEISIPPNAREGRLIVEPGTARETIIPLNFGHLDPIDTIRGVKERLFNLSIAACEINDRETPELEAAVRAFQSRQGLEVTGRIDQQTRDTLRDAHGS